MKKRKKMTLVKNEEVKQKWHLVDASDKILGRLAVQVARILMGKNRVDYTPNIDNGDYVVVINAEKIRTTGKKLEQKIYFSHSGYPGGHRLTALKDMQQKNPCKVISEAVWGMIPKGRLGRKVFRKLKVVKGSQHSFTAQKPEKQEV